MHERGVTLTRYKKPRKIVFHEHNKHAPPNQRELYEYKNALGQDRADWLVKTEWDCKAVWYLLERKQK